MIFWMILMSFLTGTGLGACSDHAAGMVSVILRMECDALPALQSCSAQAREMCTRHHG